MTARNHPELDELESTLDQLKQEAEKREPEFVEQSKIKIDLEKEVAQLEAELFQISSLADAFNDEKNKKAMLEQLQKYHVEETEAALRQITATLEPALIREITKLDKKIKALSDSVREAEIKLEAAKHYSEITKQKARDQLSD